MKFSLNSGKLIYLKGSKTCRLVTVYCYDCFLCIRSYLHIFVWTIFEIILIFAFHLSTELKTKDKGTSDFGTNVISYTALDTTANPLSFAGTYWYLLWHKQYLYAQGPTDQAADIVVSFLLWNDFPRNGISENYDLKG